MNMEKWVSFNDVCSYLGINKDTLRKMIKTKGLPAYKVDKKWKFKISEIDAWMHNNNRINKLEDGDDKNA